MTDTERIAEIRARWEGVGPWYVLRVDEGRGCQGYSIEGDTPSGHVAWADIDDRGLDWETVRQLAEAMAAAPDDMRMVLVALDAATAERDAARKQTTNWRLHYETTRDAKDTLNEQLVEAYAYNRQFAAERDAARARVAELEAVAQRQEKWLRGILEHDPEQHEVACDAWAYRRLVANYRKAAAQGLGQPLPECDDDEPDGRGA